VVGDRQGDVLPPVQAADESAIRRHEANPGEQRLALRLGQRADLGTQHEKAGAAARLQIEHRGDQLVLAQGGDAVRSGRVQPDALRALAVRHRHITEQGAHCCAVTSPKKALP
jgi:hypothetical protein